MIFKTIAHLTSCRSKLPSATADQGLLKHIWTNYFSFLNRLVLVLPSFVDFEYINSVGVKILNLKDGTFTRKNSDFYNSEPINWKLSKNNIYLPFLYAGGTTDISLEFQWGCHLALLGRKEKRGIMDHTRVISSTNLVKSRLLTACLRIKAELAFYPPASSSFGFYDWCQPHREMPRL